MINKKEYLKQLEYLNIYYGQEFKENQGTEYILSMINEFILNGNLIDFGSGSNIYFWLLATNRISQVTCVDISEEAFDINREIQKGKIFPKSYIYPLKKYKNSLKKTLNIPIRYIIANVFKDDIELEIYDNVTQFGLLGLSVNADTYIENFLKLWPFLKKNGVFLGANWVFSKKYSIEKGYTNNYLDEDLIEKISEKTRSSILYLAKIKIYNDPNYDFVLIYCMKKI